MPSQEQVLALIGDSLDYQRAAAQLGIPSGQAYLVATGLPADGGDATFPADERGRPGVITSSTQYLVYPDLAVVKPTQQPAVHEWIRKRAASDAPMTAAAPQRDAVPADPEGPEDTDVHRVRDRIGDRAAARPGRAEQEPAGGGRLCEEETTEEG